MTLRQIARLGRRLVVFLRLFAGCFGRREPRELLRVCVQGQLSDLDHKTAEGIALRFGKAPRTLQRFLESIKWDEERFHDRCQQIVARDHGHAEAIGVVDESGVAKSGDDTVGVSRQWNGNRGKVDNCVVGVHLSYAAPGFQCLLGSGLYLPEDWANDPVRRKRATSPRRWSFTRSRRSPWGSSIVRWATKSAWRLGRSTSCTVATASSWTAFSSVGSGSWPRCPSTSMAGCRSPRSCIPGRKRARNGGGARRICGWPDALLRAKFATWRGTPRYFGSGRGSGVASRTRTAGRERLVDRSSPVERDCDAQFRPFRGKSYLYAANLTAPLSASRFTDSPYLLTRQTDTKTPKGPPEPKGLR